MRALTERAPNSGRLGALATPLRCGLLALALAGTLPAQDGCLFEVLPDADAVAVGVLWSHGLDHDASARCGLARVLAESRLRCACAAAPAVRATGVKVGGDFALAFGVVAVGDADSAAAFLRGLLDAGCGEGGGVLDDDTLERLIARAALAADDAEFVFPGDVLATRARRTRLAGTAAAHPLAGDARAIAALSPDAVRAALRHPVGVRLAAVGALDDGLIDRVRGLARAPIAAVAVTASVAAAPVAAETVDVGARADAPFVAVAVPAPAPAHRATFALGLEVARVRCHRRFRLRGNELFAGAPFVRWSWLEADPLALFYRRGEQPERLLPGQRAAASAADESRAVRAELADLLRDLRANAPSEDEMRLARRALRARFALPATAPAAAALPGRLSALLLATYHGIAVEELDTVTAAAVHALLRRRLAAERLSWHVLMPGENPTVGFRRR